MKNTILGLLVAIMLFPAISMATTTTVDTVNVQESTLEEQKIQLLKQLISLLQLRIQQLIAIRDGLPVPTVLGISTANSLLSGSSTTPAVEVKKRRGGGGGGGSSSSRAANEAKETACRLAGDLLIAPAETKLAYISMSRQPVYAGWAPDTTKELYSYLTAYTNNYIATGNEFFTHIPDYRLYYALQHLRVLEARFNDYVANKTLCGEEALDATDVLVPLSAEILALTANDPVDEYIDGPVFMFEPATDTFYKDSQFEVDIQTYSATTSIDTFNLEFSYDPAMLEVTEIETPNDDIAWFIEPNYSNEQGTFRASGAFSGPNTGGDAIVSLRFKALAIGTTTLSLASSSDIHRVDNLETNIFREFVVPEYEIVADPSTPVPEPYDATLEFKSSPDNPSASILVVDKDDNTKYSIFVFEIEPSEGPVTVSNAVVQIDTPNGTIIDIVNDAELVVDGQIYNADLVELVDGDESSQWWQFELNKTFTEEVSHKVELKVELEAYEGSYDVPQDISASIDLDTRSLWDVEGYDDLNPATNFLGTVFGETHTLFGAGLYLDDVDTSTELITFDAGGSIGRFEIEFEATAIEDDFYFIDLATTSDTTSGLQFYIDGVNTISAVSAVMTSSADEETNGVYVIQEGETQTITLQVEIEASETGNFRIGLEDLFVTRNFDGVTDTQSTVIISPSDFRTDYLVILANES